MDELGTKSTLFQYFSKNFSSTAVVGHLTQMGNNQQQQVICQPFSFHSRMNRCCGKQNLHQMTDISRFSEFNIWPCSIMQGRKLFVSFWNFILYLLFSSAHFSDLTRQLWILKLYLMSSAQIINLILLSNSPCRPIRSPEQIRGETNPFKTLFSVAAVSTVNC